MLLPMSPASIPSYCSRPLITRSTTTSPLLVLLCGAIMPRALSPATLPRKLSHGSHVSPVLSRSPQGSTTTCHDHVVSKLGSEQCTDRTKELEPSAEESLEARIERLGRERPPAFKTIWNEVAFVFSITMSQLLTEFFVSGFTLILPTLILELNIPQGQSVWPATAFSLVIASTLLVFGRFGDMWGGYPVFISGLVWLLVWSIIAGFSISPLMLDLCRALQGLGPAAFLPTGVQLIGSLYRPGPRKNLVFALYGTAAVFGFFVGIFVAGVVGQFLRWGYYFWIGAILAAITLGTSIVSIPHSDRQRTKNNIRMDWLGAATIVSGLVLIVFAITESAHAESGWRTPYIPTLFVVGILSLLLAVYIEGWIAKVPLLPADLFAVSAMTPLLFALFLLYGTWGIFSVSPL